MTSPTSGLRRFGTPGTHSAIGATALATGCRVPRGGRAGHGGGCRWSHDDGDCGRSADLHHPTAGIVNQVPGERAFEQINKVGGNTYSGSVSWEMEPAHRSRAGGSSTPTNLPAVPDDAFRHRGHRGLRRRYPVPRRPCSIARVIDHNVKPWCVSPGSTSRTTEASRRGDFRHESLRGGRLDRRLLADRGSQRAR